MLPEDKFFQTNDEQKIWQRYCGFLDLSVDEFMKIQSRLLMEQIEMISGSPLGKKIMLGNVPQSVDEFRHLVPLTVYKDYEPYLSQHREDMLAEKPYFWCHSSGRGGSFKWVPYTYRGFQATARRSFGLFILACANSKYDIKFKPGSRALMLLPPPPYMSGTSLYYGSKQLSIHIIPPIDESNAEDFQSRIAKGFGMALHEGVDVIASIASVMAKAGERMVDHAQGIKFSTSLLRPPVLARLVRGWFQSKLARRPMLPRDLWKSKGIIAGGTDVGIYKDRINYYWGRPPHEIYASSEANPTAMQAWNRQYLTLVPDICFWEFIPETEIRKSKESPEYQPSTILLNEVEEGKTYELVLSHFYGMPMLRYRIGDLITVVSLKDSEAGIKLPQIVFKSRASDVIQLAGLTELDERMMWQALENCDIKYEEWSARKEYNRDQTYLSLYLELKEPMEVTEIERLVDHQLKIVDVDYRDMEAMLGIQPVRVTILQPGTFQHYYEEKQKKGADLAHLKPPHMNASDAIIENLLNISNTEKSKACV